MFNKFPVYLNILVHLERLVIQKHFKKFIFILTSLCFVYNIFWEFYIFICTAGEMRKILIFASTDREMYNK